MNVFVRFGQWLDRQATMPWYKFLEFQEKYNANVQKANKNDFDQAEKINAILGRLDTHVKTIEAVTGRIDHLESEKQIPATLAKDLAVIRSRIDRLELLTGLKREQGLVAVPGASKIS